MENPSRDCPRVHCLPHLGSINGDADCRYVSGTGGKLGGTVNNWLHGVASTGDEEKPGGAANIKEPGIKDMATVT